MATIDRKYIPAFNLENVFLDKDTGEPLANGKIYFYRDTDRTGSGVKPVYQISGSPGSYTFTSLGTEITLSSIGTIVDSLGDPVVPYFYPFDANDSLDYYYVRVESAGGVLQFERESVPYVPDDFTQASTIINFANELSNPQFVDVLFNTNISSYTYNFTNPSLEVAPVAPNWDFVISGTGACSITVEHVAPAGSLNVVSNPPFILKITSAGTISLLQLRQRLYGSPNVLGNQYVSSTFVAKTFSGNPDSLTLRYVPSDGTLDETLLSVTLDGTRTQYPTTTVTTPLIPLSDSSETAPDSYVDIIFDLPITVTLEITSVQIVGTGQNAINVPYDQTTTNRQEDQLFHYYKPLLEQKSIKSWLVGWDFPLNPAQFGGYTQAPAAIGANKSRYVWDQTIQFQSADSGVGVTAGSGGEIVLTANVDTQMALIQYLDTTETRRLLNERLAVNIAAKSDTATTATVSLWYTTDANILGMASNNSVVATLDANGKPATLLSANWKEVPRGLLGDAQFTIGTNSTAAFNDYSFSGWDMYSDSTSSASINTATYFAIVVGTASVTATDTISFESISLVNGDIPTRPAAQTKDTVLRECEYYYEKSYEANTANSTTDAIEKLQCVEPWYSAGAVVNNLRSAAFSLDFKTLKRIAPTLTFYNPSSGTANTVYGEIWNNGAIIANNAIAAFSTNWTVQGKGVKGVYYIPANATNHLFSAAVVPNGITSLIRFHYDADARLGVV